MCVGCVACRGVGCDQMSRGHVVQSCDRALQFFCQWKQTRMLDRTWRAVQSYRNRVSRVPSENGVHIHRSTFVRAGAAPVSFGGAVEVHTGIVLNRTDTELSGPMAPVALRSSPAMSVTEARFWCSGRVRLLKFVWRCLRCTVHPEYANAVMHKPTVDISCLLPPRFPRRHPHATHRHYETLSESGQQCV